MFCVLTFGGVWEFFELLELFLIDRFPQVVLFVCVVLAVSSRRVVFV